MSAGRIEEKKIKSGEHTTTLHAFFERFNLNHCIVVFIIIVLVLYRRLTTERSISVLITDPKFKPLKPDEFVKPLPIVNGDYSRLIDIDDFRFEINHYPCEDAKYGLLLLVIVSSNPTNFDKRNVIRKTWGHSTESTRLIFLLGNTSNAEIGQKIKLENSVYGDIIQGNFKDAYRNMTYKHVMGLKWVIYHCPNARYILKMDDDSVVNMDELHRFLTKEIGPWGARDLIACQLLENSRAQRSFRSKWRVSPYEYPHYYYPSYCAGWAILYSADVVHKLYAEAQKTKYFWIDDVHITGLLAEQANIPRTPFGQLQLTDEKYKILKSFSYNPVNGVFLFGPPDFTTSLMTELWNMILSTIEN